MFQKGLNPFADPFQRDLGNSVGGAGGDSEQTHKISPKLGLEQKEGTRETSPAHRERDECCQNQLNLAMRGMHPQAGWHPGWVQMYPLPREGWGKGKSCAAQCRELTRTCQEMNLMLQGTDSPVLSWGLLTGQKQPAAGRKLLITRHPALGTPGFLEQPARGLRQPGLQLG